jgi:hypothetical protein
MRWLWRRRGRRRRGDELVQRDAVHWDASWGDTFLPQLQTPSPQPDQPSSVRLGFRDGSEVALDEGSDHSQALQEIAAALTKRTTA